MDTIKTLCDHRSIRKYKNQPIDDQLLTEILNAGCRASNTGNMQIYSIITTKDVERKKQLQKFHFNQSMVSEAAVVITVFADINRFTKWCKSRGAEPAYDNFLWFFNGAIDAVLVAQNICIAAESKGLGICYLGTTAYMTKQIVDFFKCPKGVIPITTITIGYPEGESKQTDRLPLNSVVHHEEYNDYTPDDIEVIYAEKESLEETKLLIEQNELPNLARIFTDKRYTKADNIAFSKSYFEAIKEAGFFNF